MKLNFWNISLTYTHNVWCWKHIQTTLLVGWYVTWRLAIFVFPVTIVIYFIGVLVSLRYFPINLFEGLTSSSSVTNILENFELYIPYLEHQRPWLTHSLTLPPMTLGNIYLNFRALYKKQFRSFSLNNKTSIRFWSTYFWKRTLIFFGIAYILFPPFIHLPSYIEVISIAMILGLSHVCLHTEFWGVTVKKKL